MGSTREVLAVAALVPWLAVSAALAPQHVHESDSVEHHAPVAHRHVAAHDCSCAEPFHLDHDSAEVSEADKHVVWVDEVGIAEATHAFPELFVVVAAHLDIVPDSLMRVAVVPDEATLAHGPPRVSASLRAPPSAFL